MQYHETVSNSEQETIITFNEEDKTADIFTYNKRWQKHLEQRLHLKPIIDNGYEGRSYQIQKKRISLPRVPMVLSPEARKKIAIRLSKARAT